MKNRGKFGEFEELGVRGKFGEFEKVGVRGKFGEFEKVGVRKSRAFFRGELLRSVERLGIDV